MLVCVILGFVLVEIGLVIFEGLDLFYVSVCIMIDIGLVCIFEDWYYDGIVGVMSVMENLVIEVICKLEN